MNLVLNPPVACFLGPKCITLNCVEIVKSEFELKE